MIKKIKRRIRRRILDWIDICYLKVMKNCMRNMVCPSLVSIPPYSLRSLVGPADEFERVPQEFIAYFKLLCGLQMNWTILDIGCGPGRFASHLIGQPNFFQGEYRGFDVSKRAIEWAKANIAARYENFDFSYVDLQNSLYNPHGKIKAEDFLFPYEDEKFDFVFAVSVFTHLLPADTDNYLKQINRVLKRGGKALLTFVLLNGYPETLSKVAQERFGCLNAPTNWSHHDIYSVLFPNRQEALVAYQDAAIKEMIQKNNLNVEKQFYGAWNRAKDYLSSQDILILCKEP